MNDIYNQTQRKSTHLPMEATHSSLFWFWLVQVRNYSRILWIGNCKRNETVRNDHLNSGPGYNGHLHLKPVTDAQNCAF